MVRDITRFYREAPALLQSADGGPSLGDYLEQNGYSTRFIDDHLLPMASALWSSPQSKIRTFPAKYLVAFMANHQMLQVDKAAVARGHRWLGSLCSGHDCQLAGAGALEQPRAIEDRKSTRLNSSH